MSTNRSRRIQQLSAGLLLLAVTLLAGCAGSGPVKPEDTQGSLLFLGFEAEGKYLTQLGHYYVLRFSNEEDDKQEVVIRPRAKDDFVLIQELSPGAWTLDSYALRNHPGTQGFSSVSLSSRKADIRFSLAQDKASVLSWQLVVTHGEDRYGLTTTEPAFVPLKDQQHQAVQRRMDTLEPAWTVLPEPIGERPEPEPERTLLDALRQLLSE